jgi:acetolactate synthase-1/2/3 large subunit
MTYKPVILLGQGIRSNPALVEHLCSLGVPVMTTWMAVDLLPEDSPVYVGRPGIFGSRAANVILQKADEIFVFGARLDAETIGYNTAAFAPNAKRITVYDVDQAELDKLPDEYRWIKIRVDLSVSDWKHWQPVDLYYPAWLSWCKDLYNRFRPELDGAPAKPGYVDPFAFIHKLSEAAEPTDVFAIGSSGVAPCTFLQAFKVKRGQLVRNVSTIGAMGADIPMSIGAAIANPGGRVICVTGDGGFMLNSQELETARRLKLPITWFVFNNGGYGSIRNMQRQRFGGHLVGCDESSGLTLPRLRKIAQAYGVPWCELYGSNVSKRFDFCAQITALLAYRGGPQIVELMIDPDWVQYPRVMSSFVDGKWQPDPLEDMTPKLPEDELRELMECEV